MIYIFSDIWSWVEVVQRKGEGQAEQPGPLRQGYIWQTVQRSSQLQAHHPSCGFWEAEDQGLAGKGCPPGAARQRWWSDALTINMIDS